MEETPLTPEEMADLEKAAAEADAESKIARSMEALAKRKQSERPTPPDMALRVSVEATEQPEARPEVKPEVKLEVRPAEFEAARPEPRSEAATAPPETSPAIGGGVGAVETLDDIIAHVKEAALEVGQAGKEAGFEAMPVMPVPAPATSGHRSLPLSMAPPRHVSGHPLDLFMPGGPPDRK
jgi:hypothetical protein